MSPFREIAVLTPHGNSLPNVARQLAGLGMALYGSIPSWTLFT